MSRQLDFVHDQFARSRRFRILNIVDDVTRECLAAIPDNVDSRDDRIQARALTAALDAFSRRPVLRQPEPANSHRRRYRAAARVIHCPCGSKNRAALAAAASLGVVQAVNQD